TPLKPATCLDHRGGRLVNVHCVKRDCYHGVFCRQPSERNLESFTKPVLEPLCPCNVRNAGKPGAAVSFRGNSDTWPARAWSKSRWPASCSCVSSNAVVLG